MGLEIGGFILATIFGTILLNPDVSGRFAKRIRFWISATSFRLKKQFINVSKPAFFLISKGILELGILGAVGIRGVATLLIIAGLLTNISALFWLGIAIAVPYVILAMVVTFLRTRGRVPKKMLWIYPFLLIWTLLLPFIVAPPILVLYGFIVFSFGLLTLFFHALTSTNTVKKILIIVGSSLVIIGLILELIATYRPLPSL
jgi:hypothetical protein